MLGSGANRHDSLFVEPLPESISAIRRAGRSGCTGTRASTNRQVRRYLRRRGIAARIARLGRGSSTCLGRHRWVVERILGWLRSYKRLALRYKRLALRHDRTAATITALDRLVITFICAHQPPANSCNDLQYCNGNSSCRRF